MQRLLRLVPILLTPALVLAVYLTTAAIVDVHVVDSYPDGDQALVADMTRWFSTFTIREPYFFGQAYLFPLGSHLAVPLVWLGIDPFVANEVVTAICLFGPFLLIGTILQSRRSPLLALLCYATPLLLPSTLLIAGLQPRGLVEPIGIAAALIGIVGLGLIRARAALVVAFALIGLCIGSVTTAVVLLPLAVAALLFAAPTLRRAVLPAVALFGGFAAVQGLALYYLVRPSSLVFPRDQSFTLSWDQLTDNLANPVIQQTLVRILLVLIVPALALGLLCLLGLARPRLRGRRDRIIAVVASAGGALGLVAVLASTKLADSMDTVYFTPDRLLIGFVFYPLGYLCWFERTERPWNARLRVPLTIAATVLLLGLGVVAAYRSIVVVGTVEERVDAFRPVPVMEKSALEAACRELEGLQEPGRYLYLAEGRSDLMAYGCHALHGIEIAQEYYDRRSWAVGLWERAGLERQTIRPADLAALGYRDIPFGPQR